ncbi:polyhydroxyalkanoic acid system family protein [Tautonia plasticadhaerens]|uniref:Polyhydroxyalkanoic acid system protein (PHA_gran_rgn) n=1 Tax=Tautonia plasticadhaerens TaxID=2527974 RepID=A0A518H4P5_9BACT|nr:polyhydroxyalkanoic acid system family protein [Tautonia plasticadhaerens]QDV35777.1 hypothetical protein ElP_36850 [Tautonia plasticadhaerens]
MPLIEFTIKHERTEADAKARLEMAVDEAKRRYGPMIQKVEWSPDRDAVRLSATGALAEMRVDAERIHASIDLPLLSGLLGGRMATGLKEIIRKQLA